MCTTCGCGNAQTHIDGKAMAETVGLPPPEGAASYRQSKEARYRHAHAPAAGETHAHAHGDEHMHQHADGTWHRKATTPPERCARFRWSATSSQKTIRSPPGIDAGLPAMVCLR